MYCVFHHISDHLQSLILFLQILRKVGLRSDPPPLVGQNDQVLKKKRFSMAPLSDWEIANLASDIYEDHNRPVVFLMEIIEGG